MFNWDHMGMGKILMLFKFRLKEFSEFDYRFYVILITSVTPNSGM